MLRELREGPYELQAVDNGVTVLPLSREDGAGIYPQGTNQLVKQLRAESVPSQFLDEPQQRKWQVLKGDVPPDLIFAVGTGLISSAIWAAVARVLARMFGTDAKIRVRIVRQSRSAKGSIKNEWFEYEGPSSGLEASTREFTNSNEP